ncbi:hypothetical protein [Anabaena sp. CCY 9910]|uniref:hypothetical protein n=1 Tax=Anabaena sp. CCY 9910 TaxID=3103870 RepID=UPI0039DFAD6A
MNKRRPIFNPKRARAKTQPDIVVVEKQLQIMPPAPHLCQVCAVAHEPDEAHNPQSFYYQYTFAMQYKRSVTWADAIAHCSEQKQELWIQFLTKLGIDIHSPDIMGGIESKEEMNRRLYGSNSMG